LTRRPPTNKQADLPTWLLDVMRSPETGEPLQLEGDALVTPCGTRYPVVEGIPCLIPTSHSPRSGLTSREYYDFLAGEYKAQDDWWNNPYDAEIWRLEHDLIRDKLRLSGPMLDVGCGFYPHYEFTANRDVVAGDVSYESLLVARRFGDETGKVLLAQFDAAALPFATESFAAVLAGGELLNHIPGYSRAIAEFRRVLKRGGVLLLQVGAKWCLDSLWAVFDSFLGHPLGYSVTRREALAFLRGRSDDATVTWGITPSGDLQVALLSIRKLRRTLARLGLRVVDQYGANSISGLVPLPVQQESQQRAVQSAVSALIRLDRLVARAPIFRTYAGNVFVLCQKES